MQLHVDRKFPPAAHVSRTVLLVLGMHRSGTSAVTRALSFLGAALPKTLHPPLANNEAGFWESQELLQAHEHLLKDVGSSWDDWRRFPLETAPDRVLSTFKNEVLRLLTEEYAQAPLLVVKDPRICRFAPLWLDALAPIGAKPHIVIPVRHPVAVAKSLARRDGMTEGFAHLLWLRHVLDAEAASRTQPRAIISYEHLLADHSGAISRLAAALDIAWPRTTAEASGELRSFVQSDLQHHAEPADGWDASGLPASVWAAYQALLSLEADPQDRSVLFALSALRREFDAHCDAVGGAAFDELRARASRGGANCVLDQTKADEDDSADGGPKFAAQILNDAAHQRDLCAHRASTDRLEAEICQLRATVEAWQVQANLLKRRVRRAVGRVIATRRDCRELQARSTADAQRCAVLAAGFARLTEDIAAKAVERRHLLAQITAEQTKTAAVAAELTRAEAEVIRLKTAGAEVAGDIETFKSIAADCTRQLAILSQRERDLVTSASWRLTAPLRRMGRIMRPAWQRTVRARAHLRGPQAAQRFVDDRTLVETSGYFDAVWYLNKNAEVRTSGLDPLAHFLETSARERRDPGPRFSVDGYYAVNPDVRLNGVNPLVHYLRFGIGENRKIGVIGRRPEAHEFPDTFQLRSLRATSPLAIVVHVFYPEMWPELRDAVRNVPEQADIFVTLVTGASDGLRDVVQRDFPDAYIFVVPNHGRDIYPFFFLNNTGVLCQYELVCKVHTKKSPHRDDGSNWRRALLRSLLGDRQKVARILAAFAADPDIGIVAADGNVYSHEFWGSNEEGVRRLATRVHVTYAPSTIRFAAGSMFWIHPLVLRQLMALGLTADDFEPEAEQVDGTVAHAVERFTGILAQSMGFKVMAVKEALESLAPGRSSVPAAVAPDVKLIAYYLPQFHPIPENDSWWGAGFTEWRNVAKAAPLFQGHHQPRLPSELGFYDLRVPDVAIAQADLARAHGIDAFCYHYYWFDGRRLLERPLDAMLTSGKPDFPFCLCWANENWTRSWDGLYRDVLVSQTYAAEHVRQFASDLVRYFRDPRYVRHRGRPLLLIYRLTDIPDFRSAVAEWRRIWTASGIGDVHVCAVRFHLTDLPRRPQDAGVDAYTEFPPHGVSVQRLEDRVAGLDAAFDGLIYGYSEVVQDNLAKHARSDTSQLHRGVMLGWDNTARRGAKAHICHGATPGNFRAWLRGVVAQETTKRPSSEHLVFINAWNEWAEGTYLEPDQVNGRGYLEAVRSVRRGPILFSGERNLPPIRRSPMADLQAEPVGDRVR